MITTTLTYTGPRPKIYNPPSFLFNIEMHQQIEAALRQVIQGSAMTLPQSTDGSRLYIQGIDKNGVVYWEPRISDGEEEKRFEYFEWIPVRSVADIPAGAWNGKEKGK